MTSRQCGTCSLCCKLLDVPALYKPHGQWCKHANPGAGCGTHRLRPKACREFNCLWLQEDWLGEEWRPAIAKFLLMWEYDDRVLTVVADAKQPHAWRAEPYFKALKALAEKHMSEGRLVMLIVGEKRFVIAPDQEMLIGVRADRFSWEITPVKTGRDTRYDISLEKLAAKPGAAPGAIGLGQPAPAHMTFGAR